MIIPSTPYNGIIIIIIGLAISVPLFIWAYRLYRKQKNTQVTNKQQGRTLLDDIKADLVNMNVIERNTATKISLQIDLPQETVTQIGEDYEALLGDFPSTLISVALSKDYSALIKFFYTVGEILDMSKAGLKHVLVNNEEYKASKLDLEQKRLRLQPAEKHRFTQANIIRVEQLSYGVNSHIILRGILTKFKDQIKEIPAEIWHALEGIENASGSTLTVMLNDLEGDWGKEKKK
jgi:hypothetical protein